MATFDEVVGKMQRDTRSIPRPKASRLACAQRVIGIP